MQNQAIFAACMMLAAGAAFAQGTTTAKTTTGKAYMQAPSGAALYVFDNDKTPGGTPGPSTCNDQCSKMWPAFGAGADAHATGDWSIMTRKDGSKQWAYKTRPVYTFARDQQPGKVEGDGFNGNKWHLAEP